MVVKKIMNSFNKIFLFFILTLGSLNAQTMAYKCTDVDDSQFWNYFNIDYDSLHFKAGEQTQTFYYKQQYQSGDDKKYIFSNNQYTFTVTQKRNNYKKLSITDGKYTYDCNLETILKDFTDKTPILLQ